MTVPKNKETQMKLKRTALGLVLVFSVLVAGCETQEEDPGLDQTTTTFGSLTTTSLSLTTTTTNGTTTVP